MATLNKLTVALEGFPALQDALDTNQLFLFIDICCQLRQELSYMPGNSPNVPPLRLPIHVQEFLALCIFSNKQPENQAVIQDAWNALSRIIWASQDRVAPPSTLALFLKYGPKLLISWETIGPPVMHCIYPECPKHGRLLTNRKMYKATLFTRNEGPIPVLPSNFYCDGCKTTYHSNYYIHSDALVRTYYLDTTPKVLHISQRLFVEESVCELFAVMMTMSWTSATNCARIYNLAMGDYTRERQIATTWNGMQMEMEHVWNSFYLHALIHHSIRSQTCLTLPNSDIHHSECYAGALEDRNEAYQSAGRPFWNHICDGCTRVVDRGGVPTLIRAAVVDGVTIGHPCCSIHDCKEPLPNRNSRNGRPRYCLTHSGLEYKCATTTCHNDAEEGYRTCIKAECRKAEERYVETGSGMFQLKERLSRTRERLTGKNTLAPFRGAVAEAMRMLNDQDQDTLTDSEPVEIESEIKEACKGKNKAQKRKLKARFGRSRTHKDELCVYSCGIISGRTVMFGSEAPNGVRIFLNNIFPTPESLPSYIFHDNNCQLMKMLEGLPDDPLHCIALPVDVFHFKCKHKESDEYCATHCNPASYPELMENGKWTFNSSAAEQANAWIGGFLAIVREMRPERYNFFLDEVIRRQNEWLYEELEAKGLHPTFLDYQVLLRSLNLPELA